MWPKKDEEKQSGDSVQSVMNSILERQKNAFLAEGYVKRETRIDRLNRAIALIVDHKDEICESLSEDFGHRSRHVSLLGDVAPSVTALKNAKKHLRKWMKPEKRKTLFPMNLFGGKSWVEYQPKGVVGIISTWNFPVGLTFSPLADALAAGNRCMIKPSRLTPRTSKLMKHMIQKAFDETEIAVIIGGPGGGQAFSSLPFDHLIYTGSTSVGRHIMKAAAKNLVPLTLELGGKSPVIIGRSASMQMVAERLMAVKMMNAGQICVAPDYIFVPEENLEHLITAIRNSTQKLFPSLIENPDYTSIINRSHFERLQGYLEDARKKGAALVEVNPLNEDFSMQHQYKMPLTLVLDPKDDMTVMQDEIFGPIFPIKTYNNIQEAIDYINFKPRALALYYFGTDDQERREVLSLTTSGGVTINDAMMHVVQHDLPFGGIGPSGMGSYHGRDGFKTFSHAKSVYKQTRMDLSSLAGLNPPYGSKTDKTLNGQIKK